MATDLNIHVILSRMHSIPKIIIICIVAEILNLLAVYLFCNTLRIPLFFDTIFTVAVTFYLGLVPALCVSFAYNLINSLIWVLSGENDPFIFLYTICGLLIVFSTWIIARRKEELKISPSVTILYLVLIVLLSSFCTIISGGIIDYFHLKYRNVPDLMNPIKKFTESFVHQRFSLLASCILGQIPISFLDRLLSTFAGFGIYKLAERFLERR